jgi:hypothetical protein
MDWTYVAKKCAKKTKALDKLRKTGSTLDIVFFVFCALPVLFFMWSILMIIVSSRRLEYFVLATSYVAGKRVNKFMKTLIAQKR